MYKVTKIVNEREIKEVLFLKNTTTKKMLIVWSKIEIVEWRNYWNFM